MNAYDEETVIESLVLGRALTDKTFTKGKRHNVKLPKLKVHNNGNVEKVANALENAINKASKDASSICLSLSGGKDSRVLLALLKKLDLNPECITYSYKEDDPEVKIARKLCKLVDFQHKYVKITPELYFVKKNEKELLELTDGTPNYFPMMLWYGIRDKLDYDVIFMGNLMTEFMDTGEYRWYEGKDVKKALLGKEKLLKLVTDEHYHNVKNKLYKKFDNLSENEVIIERKHARFLQLKIMRNFVNWNYPAIDNDVLNETFSLPLKERVGSKLTRNILKLVSPELLKMPSARSPFSLRFPLWVHQIYAETFKRNIAKGYNHLMPAYLKTNINIEDFLKLKFDFLDRDSLLSIVREEKAAMTRLMNLQKWVSLN